MSVVLGRKRLKERGLKTLTSEDLLMNTLNLIRRQITKASALHNAQIHHTTYRGVDYDTRCVESTESHGTFCYRGQTYSK